MSRSARWRVRRKPVDAGRAEMGVLLSGLFDGERGNSGEPAGFIDVQPCGPQLPGVVELQQAGAHRGEQTDWFFTGGDAECRGARGRLAPGRPSAASSVFQIVSTRPAPTSLRMSFFSIRLVSAT